MNVNMWQHPATQANLDILRARGVRVVEPGSGYLACGMVGDGRLADTSIIVAAVFEALAQPTIVQDLVGETVLITAGGTREPIDPVRYLGNHSSGRMGYALAEIAQRRGARVLVITAAQALAAPAGCEVVAVETAEQMRDAVLERLAEATVVIKAAAVADYRVREIAPQKMKRGGPVTLELEPTLDIAREVVERRTAGTLVVVFAAETDSVAALSNGRAKLERKGADAIFVNDVSLPGLGFNAERNAGTWITHDGEINLPPMSKLELAGRLLDEIVQLRRQHS
jgi:phosphopantothenoylcysteine decarboxylase/phosphopantothenate--cysteine ligase